ncbi:GTP-binding protein [Plectosphaerella plurivora]|uniref:GTP-binding protein n=1 Tax=Plectosphaerella plurivora TaxID=936078 RepID=A0A9P9A6X7_9PEZI|nr:GTP-binding protein [Plectosphaerella plurivora]
MTSRCSAGSHILLPFLYPSFALRSSRIAAPYLPTVSRIRCSSTHVTQESAATRLNPAPEDYAAPNFADKAQLTLHGGSGGNGCISFLRDLFLPEGPPNGGDGAIGGNIYIQAVHGETSLHKLARKRFIRAGKGKNGQGSAKAGQRGEDVIITVPVGTVLREISRIDPVADEKLLQKEAHLERKMWKARQRAKAAEEAQKALEKAEKEEDEEDVEEYSSTPRSKKKAPPPPEEEEDDDPEPDDINRGKWLVYPGASRSEIKSINFPKLPRRQRFFHQPEGPLHLDLSRPTEQPILLATGGIGGLGNPHFVCRETPRPIFATKGERAVTMEIELELKLLADVGLVGLPNAGKSTLLRALSNSRTRVGNWAFTTLQPNIGTVVLDNYKGRPMMKSYKRGEAELGEMPKLEARTRFTVADIPGLIEGAHLDRGLGIAFLRHVERAGVLAFVVDLSAGDAVDALKALWNEVGLYAQMREDEERSREAEANIDWAIDSEESWLLKAKSAADSNGSVMMRLHDPTAPERVSGLTIAGKPWFVVATKGDLPNTQENFKKLKAYLDEVTSGAQPHPSGVKSAWTKRCHAVPISAINGHGVDKILQTIIGLLDE